MTLYEIEEKLYQQLNEGIAFDDQTGEVYTELDLQKLLDEKMDDYCLFMKNEQAEIEALKNEKKSLDKRIKTKEKKQEYLKNALMEFMKRHDMKKHETSKYVVSTRKSKRLIIDNADAIISEYKNNPDVVKVNYEVNKITVKKNIVGFKNYAHLEDNTSLTIK